MEQFFKTVSIIREAFENPSITADIIVGFPGETDEDFNDTCENIKKIGLLRAHIFEYSPRAGTPAAKRTDQIDPRVKKQRSAALSEICAASASEFAAEQVGKTARILLEATGGGYADNYLYVKLPLENRAKAGEFVKVKLVAADQACCEGSIINADLN